MRFWDASAIVPQCVQQSGTARALECLQDDRDVWVWWATATECLSALYRLLREGVRGDGAVSAARNRLVALQAAWSEVLPSEAVRRHAERALRIHGLGAADALQLAASLVWADGRPNGLALVTGDLRLATAADLEGFAVLITDGA